MILKKDIIQKLSSLPNRGAGTASEREASEYVAEQFIKLGLPTNIEQFRAQPSMPIIHLIHFLLLFLICTIVNRFPLAGSLLGLLVLISFWGEFTYRFFVLKRLIPRKTSQNVLAKIGRSEAKTKIVFSAHVDAARSGIIFHPVFANAAGRSKKQPLHKTILTFMLVLTIIFIIKAFGGGTWVLSIVFNVIAVLALFASLLMVQWELSPFTPGANDDLSGVAVVLGLAEELAKTGRPALAGSTTPAKAGHPVEFFFLITGAEESHCNGMNAFLKQHKKELTKEDAYFINLECVSGGRLKYVTEEGFIVFQRHHHTLIQACESIAKKYNLDLEPASTVAHSDSIVPMVKGYKSIGLIVLNESYVPTNYHTQEDTEENIDYNSLETTQDVLLKLVGLLKEFKQASYI